MRAIAALLGVALLPAAAFGDARAPEPMASSQSVVTRPGGDDAPHVRLWIERDNVFRRGERAHVYFRSHRDAHVLVVRVDTDGALDVLFPEHPYEHALIRGDFTYRVHSRNRDAFIVDDQPGLGYVFAIASWHPFDLRYVVRGRRWDYNRIGSRIHGDPFVAMHEFAERVLYDPRAAYSLDYVDYHVSGRRQYPRFLCYKCHAYRPYPVWDPYDYACRRYRVVVYDDPHYYPFRRHVGSRVVYTREHRPPPRYEFKATTDRSEVTPENFVERRRRTDVRDTRRAATKRDDRPPIVERPRERVDAPRREREGERRRDATRQGNADTQPVTRPRDEERDTPVTRRRRSTPPVEIRPPRAPLE